MLKILDSTGHKRVPYRAQYFDQQQGYRFTFKVSTGHLAETGVYFHWLGDDIRDVAFDLSCMSGCVYHCRFCAAALSKGIVLNHSDIVDQVHSALDRVSTAHGSLLDACPLYTFSFEGMGEPSIPTASRAIVQAIRVLKAEYEKSTRRVQFLISTVGANLHTIRDWANEDFDLDTLQLSLHETDDKRRRALIGDGVSSIEDTLAAFRDFKALRPKTQIKINYLLFKDQGRRNHEREDLDRLVSLLHDTGFLLKLSHLNPTVPARLSGIEGQWDGDTRECYEYVRRRYPHTYEYGSDDNLGISCGQLASYAERPIITSSPFREHIEDIHEQLIERNAVLFLGAGASRTAWDAQGLAQELNHELPAERRLRPESVRLDAVADVYLSRNRLEIVHQKLRATIAQASHPSEYEEMTRLPWRAIYTTNYDDFIERAFSSVDQKGYTTQSYIKVANVNDLIQLPGTADMVPVIKLHGCIQDPVGRQVITSTDYLEIYRDANRQGLLKRLATDVREHFVVFAGYSLSDFHISQLLFDLNHSGDARPLRIYSVGPPPRALDMGDGRSERHSIMRDKFNVTPIYCTFEEFLFELSRLRRQVRIFVAGSIKRNVPGRGTAGQESVHQAPELLKLLGERFGHEGVMVRSGATATDRAGFHVAQAMKDHDVRTYVWYGAERAEYNNDVGRMIKPYKYGVRPFDVVDKLTRECNIAVFVGGSTVSLEEMFFAYSRRLLVIPIKLADESCASNLIHSFFSLNIKELRQVESERNPSVTLRRLRSSEFLTADRLSRLDLTTHPPAAVVDTVMEIIRHYQVTELSAK